MPLYRDHNGNVVEADEALAATQQLAPVTPGEEAEAYTKRGEAQRLDENSTAFSTAKAIGSRALSSATLGSSDMLLDGLMSPAEREQLHADLAAHPYASAIAEGAGALLPALAAPESLLGRTPAGYLAHMTAPGIEAGLVEGGAAGTAKALLGMGAEGSVQAAGQYLGQSAIDDKETTAEGLAGALGTGFVFGAAGGGAALGVAKGTIAARRLFSRVMDGERAAADAASAWSLTSQSALEAEQATSATLQQRLDEIAKMKTEAMRFRNEMKSSLEEERIAASTAQPRVPNSGIEIPNAGMEGPSPLDAGIEPPQGGGQTSIYQRPVEPDFGTSVDERPPLGTPAEREAYLNSPERLRDLKNKGGFRPPDGTTALEQQLAGTKAQLDEGKALKDVSGEAINGSAVRPEIPPNVEGPNTTPRNPSRNIEEMLAEKAANDANPRNPKSLAERLKPGEIPKPRLSEAERIRGEQDLADARARLENPRVPEYGPKSRAPFSNIRHQLAQKLLPEIRESMTAELLSPQIAKEESRIVEVLDNIKASREAVQRAQGMLVESGDLTAEQLAQLRQDNPSSAGSPAAMRRKNALKSLDAAHEEALTNAQTHPEQMDEWEQKAQQIEDLMHSLPDHHDISWNFETGNIEVLKRYEKDIAAAVDVAGDGAHPVAKQIADAVNQAERDGERKIIDRTARAADDAEMHGPEYKSPKERVAYARDRVRSAQDNLNELKVQHTETKDQLAAQQRTVREGEKAKKAALKVDAKTAATAKLGSKALDIGGMLEVFDVPGLPKPHDLPVIGPLVGAYLKYRTLKKALGRAMGRVPATGTAKVATLASRTRDRIARAVDQSLGLASATARTSARYVPVQTALLAQRLFDDGLPDAKKGASITEQASVRIRELANYVNTPGAIEKDVRKQMVDVADPDLIAAAELHRRNSMEYLLANAPKGPQQGMMQTIKWAPSPAEAMSFARRMDAVNDPAGVWERFAQQHALLSLESAEALRAVYPQLFSQAQQRVVEQIAYLKNQAQLPPYRTRLQMSLLYQMPLDSALEPANLKISQSVYERKMITPPMSPTQPPTPSIAQPTNLTALFTNPLDQTR